ncbi:MAG: proteasome accessory factor PafA2 family protein [Ilumatobacteraceae bacterium]
MSAEQRLREEGIRGTVYLFKNNTDSAGNSYGCHELPHQPRRRARYLRRGAHPVPRQPADLHRRRQGAADRPWSAVLDAQRAEHIWEGVSSATTRSRPIINTATNPTPMPSAIGACTVIVGDSNMSEYSTFVKVGSAACMLRMLEDPSVVLRDMTLENPIRAIPRHQPRHHLPAACPPRQQARGERPRHPGASTSTAALRYAETKVSPLGHKALGCGSTASPPSRTTLKAQTARSTG